MLSDVVTEAIMETKENVAESLFMPGVPLPTMSL